METKRVTNEKRFDELSSNPLLKQYYLLDEDKLIMKLSFKKIELKYPLFIGWQALELPKAYMFILFYIVLEKFYKIKIKSYLSGHQ